MSDELFTIFVTFPLLKEKPRDVAELALFDCDHKTCSHKRFHTQELLWGIPSSPTYSYPSIVNLILFHFKKVKTLKKCLKYSPKQNQKQFNNTVFNKDKLSRKQIQTEYARKKTEKSKCSCNACKPTGNGSWLCFWRQLKTSIVCFTIIFGLG